MGNNSVMSDKLSQCKIYGKGLRCSAMRLDYNNSKAHSPLLRLNLYDVWIGGIILQLLFVVTIAALMWTTSTPRRKCACVQANNEKCSPNVFPFWLVGRLCNVLCFANVQLEDYNNQCHNYYHYLFKRIFTIQLERNASESSKWSLRSLLLRLIYQATNKNNFSREEKRIGSIHYVIPSIPRPPLQFQSTIDQCLRRPAESSRLSVTCL